MFLMPPLIPITDGPTRALVLAITIATVLAIAEIWRSR